MFRVLRLRGDNNIKVPANQLKEWDEVLITGTVNGTVSAIEPIRFVRLAGTIGAVFKDGGVKLWPKNDYDPQLVYNHGGKIRFKLEDIEEVILTDREEILYFPSCCLIVQLY